MTPEQRDKLAGIYWALVQRPMLTLADSPEIQIGRLNMLSDAVLYLLDKELAEYVAKQRPGDTEH